MKESTYSIENIINSLFEDDCLNTMKKIPSQSIDMIISDLPYGTTSNKWDIPIDLDSLWKEYKRIIKDNGAIVLTSHGLFTAQLIMSQPKLFKYKIVWEKSKATNFLNVKKQPLRKHEDICVFYKKHPTYNPQKFKSTPYDKGTRKDQLTGSYGKYNSVKVESSGERYPTDVIYFNTAENEGEVFHPTQKPVDLGRYLIRTYSNPGDIVLDNAFGSGSFLVAAIEEGRNFIGIEKNNDLQQFKEYNMNYIEIAYTRITKALNNLDNEKISFIKASNIKKIINSNIS